MKEKQGKCALCGKENDNLQFHHILPLDEGGNENISNLIWLCPNCNFSIHGRIREVDLEQYFYLILSESEEFRNVVMQKSFRKENQIARVDLVAQEKIGDNWKEVLIEIKAQSSFTKARLSEILKLLRFYGTFAKDAKLVFLFPGELNQETYDVFEKQNIEIWDSNYIRKRFQKEIRHVANPRMQLLLMKKIVPRLSLERRLISDLKATKPGKRDWAKYQKLVGQILERLFCPPLQTPISELSDSSRTNRRDFVLPNYSNVGFWAFIRSKYYGDYIVVDAKNYSGKITKNVALQISNYLKKHGSGLFGLIVCRHGGNRASLQTLREVWAIDKKLIIVLTDDDIEKMLIEKSNRGNPEIIIRQKIEDFRLGF